MENMLKILGFAGSLRKGSYNRSLLRAAGQLLPQDATLEVFDLSDIPPFNQDLEANMHPKVREFKSIIRVRCSFDCNTSIQLLRTRCT
jgi:chromate reductase, NAD(P)H dehydrogenase (quinone)